MKKKVIKLVSSVLIFVILLVGSFSFPAYAISTSCVNDHFDRLITTGYEESQIIRTPPSENTCPYVALSLLLTFYDTYWNEAFVDDDYEWQIGTYNSSTDTLVDTFAPIEEAEAWSEYVDDLGLAEDEESYPYYPFYALNNIENYLEPDLISIGYGLGYHNLDETKWGLTDDETVSVLQYYLFLTERFNLFQVEVNCCKESDGYDIESIMKEQIRNGYPVIYSGKRYKTEEEIKESSETDTSLKTGHAFVAYGVDESDDILLHTGWSGDEFSSYNTTIYNMDRAIIWIEFDETYLPHEHSYHYVDSVSGTPLCACQIYSTHPAHEDNHLEKTEYNGIYHWNTCHCGKEITLENHIFNYTLQMPQDNHRKSCLGCGYSTIEDHNFNTLSSIYSPTEDAHYAECACGRYGWTDHYAYSYAKNNISLHHVYCECGQLIGSAPHVLPVGAAKIKFCIHCNQRINTEDIVIRPYDAPEEIRYITDAGSYVGPDGNIYLVESDMALYLAGELDVYALVESLNAYPTV